MSSHQDKGAATSPAAHHPQLSENATALLYSVTELLLPGLSKPSGPQAFARVDGLASGFEVPVPIVIAAASELARLGLVDLNHDFGSGMPSATTMISLRSAGIEEALHRWPELAETPEKSGAEFAAVDQASPSSTSEDESQDSNWDKAAIEDLSATITFSEDFPGWLTAAATDSTSVALAAELKRSGVSLALLIVFFMLKDGQTGLSLPQITEAIGLLAGRGLEPVSPNRRSPGEGVSERSVQESLSRLRHLVKLKSARYPSTSAYVWFPEFLGAIEFRIHPDRALPAGEVLRVLRSIVNLDSIRESHPVRGRMQRKRLPPDVDPKRSGDEYVERGD